MAQRGPFPWLSRFCFALIILTLIVPSLHPVTPARAAGNLKDLVRAYKASPGKSAEVRRDATWLVRWIAAPPPPTDTPPPTTAPSVVEPTSSSAGPFGRWVGTWNTTRGMLWLKIQNEELIGEFGEQSWLWGKVSPDGRTFRGNWSLSDQRHAPWGPAILHLSDNGLSFTGEWGTGSDAPLDSPWSGTQTSTAPPPNTPTPVPNLSWNGTWQTNFGMMTLQTNGANVTGAYQDLDHGILDGRVAGTLSADHLTLTGVWSQAPTYAPPNDAGKFVIKMTLNGEFWGGPRQRNDGTTIIIWGGSRMEAPAVALTPRPPTPAPTRSN
jgi:hypothetical protein